ncbi:MAG: hypothetical protein Q9209_003794 [Squamulea sp. 1 TL-2023]
MERLVQYFTGPQAKEETNHVCAFIAPAILKHIAAADGISDDVRESVKSTIDASETTDKERQDVGDSDKNPHEPDLPEPESKGVPEPAYIATVNIFDGKNSPYAKLPSPFVRRTGQPPVDDYAVDSCYEHLTKARDFFRFNFGWKSINDKEMPIWATVRYGWNVANAYFMFQEKQMVFGNGNPEMFNFTGSYDAIGHELAHGVIQHSSGMIYHGESGAINEHCPDVMGALLEQWSQGERVDQADWLIAQDVLFPNNPKIAMRSMKAPGTAFDDPVMGKDNQPAHMKDYVNTDEDDGGVHTNSGIGNRAFYLAASARGGNAWELPGRTWFAAMTTSEPRPTYVTFALRTISEAKRLGGPYWENDVIEAWISVGVLQRANTRFARWWYKNAV